MIKSKDLQSLKCAKRLDSNSDLNHDSKVKSNCTIIHLNYKSGAIYDGEIEKDQIKDGIGLFLWPNGDQYKGEFKFNSRNGFGTQIWNDGSQYDGVFLNDKRFGAGKLKWKNGEVLIFIKIEI
jgi:hypothetical protein